LEGLTTILSGFEKIEPRMSKRWAAKSPMSGYLVAVAATLVVLLLRLLLSTLLGETAYFFPFVIAVTVSAWYGGLKPGLLATVLGSIFAIFFFVPPHYTLWISDPKIAIGLFFFVLASVTVSLVCDALHKALRTLEVSEASAVQHVKAIERRDQALRDAQDQLHLITDTMSALVTRCTRDLKYSWVSKPYADWLRQSREKIIGASIESIIGRAAFEVLLPYYQSALNGETVRLELEVDYHTIGPRWVNTVYTPTFGRDGKPDGWVGVVVDIDAQKRSEEALRVTDRRKDTFLAVLAHELRNPLAPLRNSLEILKRSDANSKFNERARTTMERQLSHMVRLVDDLLDLSRINSDKLELQRQPVALAEIVSQAVETVRPLIADAGHELLIDLPSEPMQLNADTVRLSQAFSNLLNNACKYTDPGGCISLTAVRENGQVVVAIRDNGMGIPADLSPKIFEMFTQANQSIERQHGGLGIGLALVKRLVEMHEGEVSAGANPMGQGSEFRVRLPLMTVSRELESSTRASGISATPAGPMRVLVVDDNKDSAETLSFLLQLVGNEVSVAHDGEEAVQMAIDLKPDVVLLDIGLPKMNGYEVARQIRLQPWGSTPLLVAITGWGQAEDKDLSRQAGFDHHLVKPVEPEALLKLIEKRKTAH
jgi:signal transduction histidine kinase/ActR/RegA family two-component response regulator